MTSVSTVIIMYADIASYSPLLWLKNVNISFPPANCSDPIVPINGFIVPYQNTTEGAKIVFGCDSGYFPTENVTAVCGADGRWNPNPSTLVCTCKSTYSMKMSLGNRLQ